MPCVPPCLIAKLVSKVFLWDPDGSHELLIFCITVFCFYHSQPGRWQGLHASSFSKTTRVLQCCAAVLSHGLNFKLQQFARQLSLLTLIWHKIFELNALTPSTSLAMSFLFYKKPAFVEPQHGPLSACQIVGHPSSAASSDAGVPPELSFENIICNKCAPPCSLQDFLDYLMYISHDAENLQFYLWMVDYHCRFRNAPPAEKKLSPRWKACMPLRPHETEERVASFDSPDPDIYNEDISSAASTWEGELSDNYKKPLDTLKFSVSPVNDKAHQPGDKEKNSSWQSSVMNQPFRTEMNRIMNHYIMPGSPRELNLSHDDRVAVLEGIRYTTPPLCALASQKDVGCKPPKSISPKLRTVVNL